MRKIKFFKINLTNYYTDGISDSGLNRFLNMEDIHIINIQHSNDKYYNYVMVYYMEI